MPRLALPTSKSYSAPKTVTANHQQVRINIFRFFQYGFYYGSTDEQGSGFNAGVSQRRGVTLHSFVFVAEFLCHLVTYDLRARVKTDQVGFRLSNV